MDGRKILKLVLQDFSVYTEFDRPTLKSNVGLCEDVSEVHSFLISALDAGDWSASRLGRFTC
jgi:hypothetical protein